MASVVDSIKGALKNMSVSDAKPEDDKQPQKPVADVIQHTAEMVQENR